MSNKKSFIPKFKTDNDAAAFFDNHDSTDFIQDTTKANMSFPQPMHKIVISLDDKEWRLLQRKAILSKVSYAHLLKKMLHAQLTTA